MTAQTLLLLLPFSSLNNALSRNRPNPCLYRDKKNQVTLGSLQILYWVKCCLLKALVYSAAVVNLHVREEFGPHSPEVSINSPTLRNKSRRDASQEQ